MKIEETIKENGLPCNSLAMINRLKELLAENGSNCLSDEKQRADPRIKAVLWLINSQVFGQLGKIDLCDQWAELVELV